MTSQRYGIMIGRDLMKELGLDVLARKLTKNWDNAIIPWKDINSKTTDAFFYDSKAMKPQEKELKKLNNILDAKYQKTDLQSSVSQMEHLNKLEKENY